MNKDISAIQLPEVNIIEDINNSMSKASSFMDNVTEFKRSNSNNNESLKLDPAGLEKIRQRIENLSDDIYTNKIISGDNNSENGNLIFDFPDWSYKDWINERNMWKRGITSIGGEFGWFYFKVFFKFDTQHGLLGGLLNNTQPLSSNNNSFEGSIASTNTAGKFLKIAMNTYNKSKLGERYLALHKFASILSYIQSNAPWFFKSVKGLNNATYTGTEFTKEKSIELTTLQESIDMRLTTLLDLYKFACFDEINHREIIPENLRKFEMSILIYGTPISIIHDSMYNKTTNARYDFKRTYNSRNNYNNILSYKLYTFKNCEISLPDIGSFVPGELNNETAFAIGNGNLKITYDRCYYHTSNEFMGMLFGSDGFYYNQYSPDKKYLISNISSSINQELRYQELRNYLLKPNVTEKELLTISDELGNWIYDKNISSENTQLRNSINTKLKRILTNFNPNNTSIYSGNQKRKGFSSKQLYNITFKPQYSKGRGGRYGNIVLNKAIKSFTDWLLDASGITASFSNWFNIGRKGIGDINIHGGNYTRFTPMDSYREGPGDINNYKEENKSKFTPIDSYREGPGDINTWQKKSEFEPASHTNNVKTDLENIDYSIYGDIGRQGNDNNTSQFIPVNNSPTVDENTNKVEYSIYGNTTRQ